MSNVCYHKPEYSHSSEIYYIQYIYIGRQSIFYLVCCFPEGNCQRFDYDTLEKQGLRGESAWRSSLWLWFQRLAFILIHIQSYSYRKKLKSRASFWFRLLKNIISSGWKTHVSNFLKLLHFSENLVVVGFQGAEKNMELPDSCTIVLWRNCI